MKKRRLPKYSKIGGVGSTATLGHTGEIRHVMATEFTLVNPQLLVIRLALQLKAHCPNQEVSIYLSDIDLESLRHELTKAPK